MCFPTLYVWPGLCRPFRSCFHQRFHRSVCRWICHPDFWSFIPSIIWYHFTHRLFISRLETDSFVFFSSKIFVLKYVDSSNQWNFFLHDSLILQICPIKSVEYAWPQKNFATRALLVSSMLFSFSPRVCF